MPSLDEHESNNIVKILVAADSGGGKTGALACLVDAGFNVRILDFDNGLSVLKNFVTKKENLKNVHYVTGLRDELKLLGGRIGITKAPAFQRAMDALDSGGEKYWGKSGAHIGPLKDWTPKDILVVDSYSMAGRASLQMVMHANAAGMKSPEIQHYGTAMENLEKWLGMLTSDVTPCHVILNTHVTSPKDSAKLVPEALGDKLGPKLGRYLDNMISLSLTAGERTFKLKKDGAFACKIACPNPPDILPIKDGWVTIFKLITGKSVQEILAS